MPTPPSPAALEDHRAETLSRLAGLGRLAGIAALLLQTLRTWVAGAALGVTLYPRALAAFEKLWRATRLIEALDARLRDTLRQIEAGVRPMPDAPAANPAETLDRPEAPDRPEQLVERERLTERERFACLAGLDTLLKRPIDEIVARILADLSSFPAWRRLAEAAWAGQDLDPDEAARLAITPLQSLSAHHKPTEPWLQPWPERIGSAPSQLRPAPA